MGYECFLNGNSKRARLEFERFISMSTMFLECLSISKKPKVLTNFFQVIARWARRTVRLRHICSKAILSQRLARPRHPVPARSYVRRVVSRVRIKRKILFTDIIPRKPFLRNRVRLSRACFLHENLPDFFTGHAPVGYANRMSTRSNWPRRRSRETRNVNNRKRKDVTRTATETDRTFLCSISDTIIYDRCRRMAPFGRYQLC